MHEYNASMELKHDLTMEVMECCEMLVKNKKQENRQQDDSSKMEYFNTIMNRCPQKIFSVTGISA